MANRSFINGMNVNLYIDASDLMEKVELCRAVLSKPNFEKLIRRTFNEVGRRAATPIAKETVQKYQVTKKWVKSQILAPKIETGANVRLIIPLRGHKGSIGGRFRARVRKAGRIGHKSVKGKIVSNVVKGQPSVMPDVMKNQGGNPPFLAKGVAFTRKGPNRFPIVSVKGLAVPQMPLNRAASPTQDRILELAEERLEHNFQYMFRR